MNDSLSDLEPEKPNMQHKIDYFLDIVRFGESILNPGLYRSYIRAGGPDVNFRSQSLTHFAICKKDLING